jgi:hypothetical protein
MKLYKKIKDWFLAEDIPGDLGANIMVSVGRITLSIMALISIILVIVIKIIK